MQEEPETDRTRHEFRFRFDLPFVRAALRRDFVTKGAVRVGVLAVILIGGRVWIGSFEPPVVWIVALGMLVVTFQTRRLFHRSAARVYEFWCQQAPDHTILYRLDEEGFEVALDKARSRHSWVGLRRLWRYDDVWILEVVKDLSLFFPPAAASDEAREFLVERCRAAGVRV